MSLLNKFSVSYNLEQANRKKHNAFLSKTGIKSNGIRNQVAQDLLELGYNIESLMMLLKIHPFTTVEEALNLLSKDPDTHLYNHKYYNPNIKPNSKFNIIDEPCLICQGKKNEHGNDYDYEIENDKLNSNTINNNELGNSNKIISNKISCNNSNNINNDNNGININQSKEIKNMTNPKLNTQTNNDFSQTPFVQNENNTNNINSIIQSTNKNPNNTLNNNKLNNIGLNNNNTKNINIYTSNLISSTSSQSERKKRLDFGKIQIPKETLLLFDSPDICRICFSNKVNPNNIAQISCGHFFCDNCIKTYLTNKIINGQVLDITCLLGGCPKRYSEEEIEANVEEEVFKKYKKFKNIQIKLSNPNKIYVNCPFPDCEEIVDCTNPESEFMICNNNHIFCYKCHKLGKHPKGKCLNDEINLLQQIQNKNKNGKNFKQCPKCQVIIEKNEGCNQMHCINCGYDFCWLCLKRYTENHYAMYNVGGCPGMRYESDSGYKWRKNPCLKFLWYLFSCLLGFLAVLLIIVFYLLFGCAYEFIKCYTKKKNIDDDDDDFDGPLEFYGFDLDYNNEESQNESNRNEEEEKKSKVVIAILIIVGIICQPIYLMFYVLYGLMECYRRFNCWFYYVDY